MDWSPDYSKNNEINMQHLKKHIQLSDYCSERYMAEEVVQLLSDIFDNFDPTCKVSVTTAVLDVAFQMNLQGVGYGQILNFIMKAVSFELREEIVNNITSDFANHKEYDYEDDSVESEP